MLLIVTFVKITVRYQITIRSIVKIYNYSNY